MNRPAAWRRLLGGVFFVLVMSGCIGGGSRGGGLFGGGVHREIEDAKNISRSVYEPAPVPRELDKRNAPPFIVEPGDVLLIYPASLDSPVRLPGDQPVLPDGSIQLGQYGRLIVSGKTLPEIETAARAQIQAQVKDAGPILVRLITRVSKVYYVLGEVNAPGAYTLNGRETVLDGIVTAGGLNDRASRKRIILSRPTKPNSCRVVLPVCYNQIVQLGDTTTNYQLAAGDRIYVPSQSFFEDVLHQKKECPNCGGPQVPCPLGGCDTGVEMSGTYAPALPAGTLPTEGMPLPVMGSPGTVPATPAPTPAAPGSTPLPFPRQSSSKVSPVKPPPSLGPSIGSMSLDD